MLARHPRQAWLAETTGGLFQVRVLNLVTWCGPVRTLLWCMKDLPALRLIFGQAALGAVRSPCIAAPHLQAAPPRRRVVSRHHREVGLPWQASSAQLLRWWMLSGHMHGSSSPSTSIGSPVSMAGSYVLGDSDYVLGDSTDNEDSDPEDDLIGQLAQPY